jgi:hypothetical protein
MTIRYIVGLLITITSFAANYQRGTYIYTVKKSATPAYFGKQCAPTSDDVYLVSWEIAIINDVKSIHHHFSHGRKVILPVYVNTDKYITGDIQNWHVAAWAGNEWGVNPALLVAIRTHENPSRSADYKCCGVKWGSGWYPGGMRGQYLKAASIVQKRAKAWKESAKDPSDDFISRLGRFYAEGSTEWGECVNALFNRAER